MQPNVARTDALHACDGAAKAEDLFDRGWKFRRFGAQVRLCRFTLIQTHRRIEQLKTADIDVHAKFTRDGWRLSVTIRYDSRRLSTK